MFDRAKLVEILTAPYIGDSDDGIVALDPHALKKLFTTNGNLLQEMEVEGERKRLAMAGETGAIEEDYRQGLTSHATRLNKVQDSLEGWSTGFNGRSTRPFASATGCRRWRGSGRGRRRLWIS
ncbi:unnamed protein product [Ectocarpus sp. 6 AP-2014]